MADPARLTQVREARRRLAEDGPPFERRPGDFAAVALPRADGDVLRDLLGAERARTVVEVGLGYGSSALAVAEALAATEAHDVRHVVIDPHQSAFGDSGWQAIEAAGAASVTTLLRERSELALPRLVDERLVADAAFVDGSHVFHRVFVDLCYLGELVRGGGLVVADDAQAPSVATALAYFERNCGWDALAVGAPTRLAAFRLPTRPVERGFEDFTPFDR